MDLAFQCKVQGYDTFRFVCPSCAGVVNLQTNKAPNGETLVRQVVLQGSAEEYRPEESHRLDGARRGGPGGWVVDAGAAYNRRFDLTGDIKPAFSVTRLDGLQGHGVPRAAPMAQNPAHVAAAMQAQRQAAAMVAMGYAPPPGMIRQPVAFTLGNRPNAVRPDPNELRRRILGLPRARRF